jgi:hypothetical protein
LEQICIFKILTTDFKLRIQKIQHVWSIISTNQHAIYLKKLGKHNFSYLTVADSVKIPLNVKAILLGVNFDTEEGLEQKTRTKKSRAAVRLNLVRGLK